MSEKPISFIRRKEILQRTGLPASTLYELINCGEFPRPVKLGPRVVGWVESEVEEWFASKIEQRNSEK